MPISVCLVESVSKESVSFFRRGCVLSRSTNFGVLRCSILGSLLTRVDNKEKRVSNGEVVSGK